MSISGHKDVRMLIERYTHPGLNHKIQAVKSLDSLSGDSISSDNLVTLDQVN
jgi:hypothetical protein